LRERSVEDVQCLGSIVDRRIRRHECDQERKGLGLGQMSGEDVRCLDSNDNRVPEPLWDQGPGSSLDDVQHPGSIAFQGIRHEAAMEDAPKELGDDSEVDSCQVPVRMHAGMDTWDQCTQTVEMGAEAVAIHVSHTVRRG
jgi:hypothetical protein